MTLTRSKLFLAGLLVVAFGISGSPVEYPTAGPVDVPQEDPRNPNIAFENVSEEVGFRYTADTPGVGAKGMISDIGVYAADIDKDGWTDLLAVGARRPVLFKNVRGQFRRSESLPVINRSVRSALFLDYDADGWEDLLLVSDDRQPLLLKNDHGSFERVDSGFDRPLAVPIGASAADYNNDGCVDLFVIQNGRWNEEHPFGLYNVSVPLDADNGKPNVLFRGTCSGFRRVEDTGIRGTRWSLATSFIDLTGDGWADIHVANDFNRDILYVNQQDGSFERVVLSNHTDRNGMSSEVADVTGDGRPDIFITNIFHPVVVRRLATEGQQARAHGNTLLVNRGGGSFVDRAKEFKVQKGGWGWAAALEDFDNDGDLDLFHTTQMMDFHHRNPFYSLDRSDIAYLESNFPSYWYPLVATWNGGRFVRQNASAVGFTKTDGRGIATLDYDRDGRLDLVVANARGGFKLYRNVGKTKSSLQVVLDGEGRTLRLGAIVSVATGDNTDTRQFTSNSDFLSQDSRILHFGTGANDNVNVTVKWPDGYTQSFRNVQTGQRIIVTRTQGIASRHEYEG